MQSAKRNMSVSVSVSVLEKAGGIEQTSQTKVGGKKSKNASGRLM